ncbi:hypothetical protein E2C01_046836 [Portunus trituberculatus]|uniref:Uncharacterized protein n=1 Tax=Portunus trituberculatus TaxID=210409 RepID=A0A5B7G8U7_PORTR|nr:hypothetical protein [Portunus trituberculatus]
MSGYRHRVFHCVVPRLLTKHSLHHNVTVPNVSDGLGRDTSTRGELLADLHRHLYLLSHAV